MTDLSSVPALAASSANLTRNSRAERARMPVALHVAEDVAIQHGVCIRPITQRVTDTYTGEVTLVDVPCGATLETKCPLCSAGQAVADAPVPRRMARRHRPDPG